MKAEVKKSKAIRKLLSDVEKNKEVLLEFNMEIKVFHYGKELQSR